MTHETEHAGPAGSDEGRGETAARPTTAPHAAQPLTPGPACPPAGRTPDGRFGAGNPGKPPGARRKVTLAMEAILEQAAEALTERLVDLATKGELRALKLCVDRLAPARRQALVEFDMPPVD